MSVTPTSLVLTAGLIILAHLFGFIANCVALVVKKDRRDREDRLTMFAYAAIVGALCAAVVR